MSDFARRSIGRSKLSSCVYIFLTCENHTYLTHMNGHAANRFGCCLLMHGRGDTDNAISDMKYHVV